MGLATITGGGAFTRQNINSINLNFAYLQSLGITPGNVIWLNPASDNLALPADGSQARPYTDIVSALGAAVAGNNDVILLVGDGTSAATARITANLDWNKDATHLIGVASPTLYSQRARIAPTTTGTAFANFFTLSASGCVMQNVQFYQGFATGTTSQIAVTVTGSRNVFQNCHIAGMADDASAQSTGSRNLKLSGSENLFASCVVGVDTVARTVANASVEFSGGCQRNVFRQCEFPFYATNSGVLGVLGTGASCIDRQHGFEDCNFVNAVKSGAGTGMAVLVSFTNAAPGGLLYFKRCMTVGVTKFGDTNGLACSYIDMPAVSASAGGLGVNPS